MVDAQRSFGLVGTSTPQLPSPIVRSIPLTPVSLKELLLPTLHRLPTNENHQAAVLPRIDHFRLIRCTNRMYR